MKNINIREQILYKEDFDPNKYGCGTRRYENLTLENAKKLVKDKFLNPNDAQNASPTAQEFIDFMEEHPQFTAHGYSVSPDRSDCRVTIEGIECNEKVSAETLSDFIDLCRYADEFSGTNGGLYAWWD